MKTRNRFLAILVSFLLCLAMLPAATFAAENDGDAGDVQLFINGSLYETYDTIQEAVDYLKSTLQYTITDRSHAEISFGYESAEIRFTGVHEENVDATLSIKDTGFKVTTSSDFTYIVPMSNIAFDGQGSGVLNGKITLQGDNITIQNIHFKGDYNQRFSYYSTDGAIVIKGDAGLTNSNRIVTEEKLGSAYVDTAGDYRNIILTNDNINIKNNEFEGYSFVSNFGVWGGTVQGLNLDNNTIHDCMFVFHTSDAEAVTLSVTNNTMIGTPTDTLASCVAATTLTAFENNKLIYTGFGLQNCECSMETFLEKNTYDHGYVYDETVDYAADYNYYFLPSSTTLMTVLPEGVYSAVWTSDYNTSTTIDIGGGEMHTFTYTQQDAIDAACEASEDPTYAKITYTGGGEDGEGNPIDGRVAIGYFYTSVHLGYAKITEPYLDKSILVNDTPKDQIIAAAGDPVDFQLESIVPDALSDAIDDSYDSEKECYVGIVKDGAEYTLTFHDLLDTALELNTDTIKVCIGDKELEKGSDYTLSTKELADDCTFEISMDLLALYSDNTIDENDFGKTAIIVTYTATLKEAASAYAYYNTAWVAYPDGESEKDKVEVDTYGIRIYKIDSSRASVSDASKSNASFRLDKAVFHVYTTDPSSASGLTPFATLTTGADGNDPGVASLDGLGEGTYYLKEVQAPDGYVYSDKIITVNIPANADKDTYIAHIGVGNAPIPSTGGMGTRMYLIGGACLIAAAGALFIFFRKKRKFMTA